MKGLRQAPVSAGKGKGKGAGAGHSTHSFFGLSSCPHTRAIPSSPLFVPLPPKEIIISHTDLSVHTRNEQPCEPQANPAFPISSASTFAPIMCVQFAEQVECPRCGEHQVWEGYRIHRCMRYKQGLGCHYFYMRVRKGDFRPERYNINTMRQCRPRPAHRRPKRTDRRSRSRSSSESSESSPD